jgi:DNA modification methylase
LASLQTIARPRKKQINRLNHLEGKEWIKFTKSWFKHNPPRRDRAKLVHPAGFPETLVQGFIEFFTKRGMWVLDPFLGSGSTLLAARMSGRNGIGADVNKRYISMAKKRLHVIPESEGTKQIILAGDSRKLGQVVKDANIVQVDFCITSPPYWDQLKRASLRQRGRQEKGWDTVYSRDSRDIGNISDYEKFLDAEQAIFDEVYGIMKPGGYLVVVTNNVFFQGRLYPLAFDTFKRLAKLWVPKDEKIWLHDDKRLLPLGIYNAWVGNRSHQYCLIFRKEDQT